MAKLRKANGNKAVNNLVFFHIPLREYRDAWANVIDKLGDGKTPNVGDKFVSDRGTTEFIYGTMGENNKPKRSAHIRRLLRNAYGRTVRGRA